MVKHNVLPKCERLCLEYVDFSDKYVIGTRNYQQQYAPLYSTRLTIVREHLLKKVKCRWESIPILQMQDLEAEENKNKQCIITGTIYKDQHLKPSILKEISAEHNVPMQPLKRFTDDGDMLILEDELQRIKLNGNVCCDDFVTGVVAGFLGECIEGGIFKVQEWIVSGPIEPPELPLKHTNLGSVCLVSGMNISSSFETCIQLQLLLDFLNGLCSKDLYETSRVSRLIVAGGILAVPEKIKHFSQTSKMLTKNAKVQGLEYLKLADELFSQISVCINVDVMPGKTDPSNFQLPQQSFHPCLFPQATSYTSFHLATNPYEFSLNGIRILGTSGQNVTDVLNFTNIESPIEALEKIVNWGHIAPSCPDTLACYPFDGNDPFIVRDGFHVYFAGNQSKYEEKLIEAGSKKVKLISIPKFSETGSVVLLDLNTLQCQLMTINLAIK